MNKNLKFAKILTQTLYALGTINSILNQIRLYSMPLALVRRTDNLLVPVWNPSNGREPMEVGILASFSWAAFASEATTWLRSSIACRSNIHSTTLLESSSATSCR